MSALRAARNHRVLFTQSARKVVHGGLAGINAGTCQAGNNVGEAVEVNACTGCKVETSCDGRPSFTSPNECPQVTNAVSSQGGSCTKQFLSIGNGRPPKNFGASAVSGPGKAIEILQGLTRVSTVCALLVQRPQCRIERGCLVIHEGLGARLSGFLIGHEMRW